jgi:hypothetical protein
MSLMTTQSVHLSTSNEYRIQIDHMVVGEGTPSQRIVFTLDIGDRESTRITIFATREQLLEIEHVCRVAVQDFDAQLQENELIEAAAAQAKQESEVNYDSISEGEQDSGVDFSNGAMLSLDDIRGTD